MRRFVRFFSTQSNPFVHVESVKYRRDDTTNVTPNTIDRIARQLHRKHAHPINIVKKRVENHVQTSYRTRNGLSPLFTALDDISPVVTVRQNFDSLLVPRDHPSRSKNDNYYINSEYMLRAHTTAHESDLIGMGLNAFLLTGDVYRRDEIDATHYPVFHQMEGVRLFTEPELFANCEGSRFQLFENGLETDDKQAMHTMATSKTLENDLKRTLTGIVRALFGDVKTRWIAATFPFTHPSWELEIFFQGDWLELLGCGVLQQDIVRGAGALDQAGWAFGIGLDRLAMALFRIPDIRLFWSEDPRFLSQFAGITDDLTSLVEFKPYSKYPPCYKDITFWIPEDYNENDFYEIVRSVAGDLAEEVKLIDDFRHVETGRRSHCYRINYRSMDRTLTNKETNELQEELRNQVELQLGGKLR
ncbi:phenylalanine--tRNA ligase, mitochondrial-like isoform X2 [Oscarella lobularis]|uniref:phenylalanine--tRNA ligase, mitochondrial-like isoform X2 n=1 Tax=Oscarella lobularis TaxID=121494 RepID=UPI0033143182